MEIEKLIESLKICGNYHGCNGCVYQKIDNNCTDEICVEAATALEHLQAENDRLRKERNEAVIDMTALMAGQCCDLCAVEHCIVRGKTEMCATFKWRGPKEE